MSKASNERAGRIEGGERVLNAGLSRAVLNRLYEVAWDGDWDVAVAHARSRALLMREFLRRAAVWAQEFGGDEEWPFFDVTRFVAPALRLDQELEAELEHFVAAKVPTPSMARTCRGAVRWAALEDTDRPRAAELPEPRGPLHQQRKPRGPGPSGHGVPRL